MDTTEVKAPFAGVGGDSRFGSHGHPWRPLGAEKEKLTLAPISLKDANAFVAAHHRHHKPVVGHKFSISCLSNGILVGVMIAGRPVSRYLDNGYTLEVTRLCTTGAKNSCSILYAAAARAAKAMGYLKIITYWTQNPATSILAAGWTYSGQAGGKCWTGERRPDKQICPAQMKKRYEKSFE